MASSFSQEDGLFDKAAKLQDSAGRGFNLLGGRTAKYERAVEMYKEAANAYRAKLTQIDDPAAIAHAVDKAGDALDQAALITLHELGPEEKLDAVNLYNDAFKLYRQPKPDMAAGCLKKAIDIQKQAGRLRPAATNSETLALHYQQVLGDNKEAIAAYKGALKCYEQDSAPALENKITLALSDLQALEADYHSAIQGYESAADKAQNNNLLAWNIKNYLFQAGICHLATGDMVATARAFDEWRGKHGQFVSTREFQLLNDLKEACDSGDQDMFADRLFQFDQMQKLNKWQTTMLLRIKEKIEEKDEDFS